MVNGCTALFHPKSPASYTSRLLKITSFLSKEEEFYKGSISTDYNRRKNRGTKMSTETKGTATPPLAGAAVGPSVTLSAPAKVRTRGGDGPGEGRKK